MRILVTGAGGLIGRELVGSLADRGHSVTALLHRSTALHRNDGRPIEASPHTGAPPSPGSVATLLGDVRHVELGMGPGMLAALIRGLDLIVHCAAVTGFTLDAAVYQQVNVDGTANVLALAGTIPVLHVSTAYVCGRRNGPIAEHELDRGQAFANGYESSKAAAERLVAVARDRGARVAIARPSIVVGASDTGAIGGFGSIYGLIRLVAEGHLRILPAAPGASLDLVPIDHVAGGLADITERIDDAAGQNFHLVSGQPVPVAALTTLAQDYPQLYAPRFVPPEAFDPTTLPPKQQQLTQQVAALLAGYLQRDPRFQNDNLRALSGRVCPPVDHGFLRRLIDRCIAAGYIKVRRPSEAA